MMVVGALAGYVSAVQTLSHSGTRVLAEDAHWRQVLVDAKDPYALYALGHFMQDQVLPPQNSTRLYERSVDDDGKSLRSECSYVLAGPAPQARWWSVGLGAAGGAAGAAGISARDVILTGDDQLTLHISKHPLPGNWLAMPDLGNMRVSLVLNEVYAASKGLKPMQLPSIQKLGCE